MLKTYADIKYINIKDNITYNLYVIYCCSVNDIWNNVKKTIKEVKNDLNNTEFTLSFYTLYNQLIKNDMFRAEDPGGEVQSYHITITYDNNEVLFIANSLDGVELVSKKYLLNVGHDGNCVDDFLRRGVIPLTDSIHECVLAIDSRKNERKDIVEYHRSWCYEKDFTQISMIKKYAEKLVQNCNTHLERISEFYTRL